MKWAVVSIYLFSIVYVHFRGRTRLPVFRQLFDHSSLVAPMNVFMYTFSRVPTSNAYLKVSDFPELAVLQQNWQEIRKEAQHLLDLQKIRAAEKNDDAGFNSFFKAGWKRFYLKWYDAQHPSAAELCPYTVGLLRTLPSVKAAMFAELPPGGVLRRHRDPFAGSLRYHLGLMTPNDDRCFIEVNGERYSWRDGEGVMFDETFIHHAENFSDRDRVILFCDVERPLRYRWAQAVNRFLGYTIVSAASSPNETGDETGGINRVFRFFWHAGAYRRRLKKWSRPVYYLVKFSLIAAAIAFFLWV